MTNEATGIELVRNRSLGLAVLSRPERRNAISQAMEHALHQWYPRLARDAAVYAAMLTSRLEGVFSVGGDVRELVDLAQRDLGAARAALGSEIQLCWLHECFSKPTVSLIDGTVMGSGVGLTLYGTHRIAGDSYRFSMPEAAIGYFPDCGVAHAFARMSGAMGLYLGLTGREAGPSDAFALGLVTHCIPRSHFAEIEKHLADADPVDPILDKLHRDAGQGPLITNSARIARYFDAPFLVDILSRLEKPRAGDEAWAAQTLSVLRSRSPLALALTFRSIAGAANLDIRDTLLQDFRLAWRLVAEPDFREGVRAVLIDKDKRPRWRHARVEDVPAGEVEGFFAPLEADELKLPTRAEMQAARV